jgi:hypothetical protein
VAIHCAFAFWLLEKISLLLTLKNVTCWKKKFTAAHFEKCHLLSLLNAATRGSSVFGMQN